MDIAQFLLGLKFYFQASANLGGGGGGEGQEMVELCVCLDVSPIRNDIGISNVL